MVTVGKVIEAVGFIKEEEKTFLEMHKRLVGEIASGERTSSGIPGQLMFYKKEIGSRLLNEEKSEQRYETAYKSPRRRLIIWFEEIGWRQPGQPAMVLKKMWEDIEKGLRYLDKLMEQRDTWQSRHGVETIRTTADEVLKLQSQVVEYLERVEQELEKADIALKRHAELRAGAALRR